MTSKKEILKYFKNDSARLKNNYIHLQSSKQQLCSINYTIIIFILAFKRADNDML